MKKILRWAFAAAVGAIGLSACDPTAPPSATLSRPVECEAIPAGETLTDVVREALAEMVRDEDAFSRARRLGALLPTLGPEFVPTVKQLLADPTTPVYLGATDVALLVRFWATHEPEDASRWAVEQAPAVYRIDSVFSSLTLWAEADPQAALVAARRWMEQRADVRDAVQTALVVGWFAANDRRALEQFIHDLGIGWSRQRALSIFVRAMIRAQGLEAVMRWAESVPDDDARYKLAVYRQVASGLANFDLAAGRRWCEAHCDGPYGDHLLTMVAGQWVRRDGAAALAWLSSTPEGHEKNNAVRGAFGHWADLDREAALGWMAAQTSGEPDPWLRPIFPVYARLLVQDSPADAIEWAERTEGDANREFVLIQVARAWFKADEAAAEAWLLQSPLSEEAREQVRAPRGPPLPNR